MQSQLGWTFGNVEIVLPGVTMPAAKLMEYRRIDSEYELSRLLYQWLRDPLGRSALLEVSREVTPHLFHPALSRSTAREYDNTIVAALLRASGAGKFHALLKANPQRSGGSRYLRGASGASWQFDEARIILPGFSLTVDTLVNQVEVSGRKQFLKYINAWLRQSERRSILVDIYRAIIEDPSLTTQQLGHPDSDGGIAEALETAWLKGKMLLLRSKSHSGGAGQDGVPGRAQGAGAGGGSATSSKTWIEIVLVDEHDQPVPGIKYRLKITDGSVREGSLDSNGRVRINGIDPGSCEVSFPEIDAREWTAA